MNLIGRPVVRTPAADVDVDMSVDEQRALLYAIVSCFDTGQTRNTYRHCPRMLTQSILTALERNTIDPDDPDFRIQLSSILDSGLTLDDVAELTTAIVRSANIAHVSETPGSHSFTDVASTGGPASLTTLLPPIQLALMGAHVFKVSSRGNPAGAIDTLESIPGFRSNMSVADALAVAERHPYVHVAHGSNFVPADESLMIMRRRYGMMSRTDLIISSLLSKKLVTPIRSFVLDVRAGSGGNVGSKEQAAEFAHRFVNVARILGITVRCVISGPALQTRFIGRSESLRAVIQSLTDENVVASVDRACLLEGLDMLGLDTSRVAARLQMSSVDEAIAVVAKLLSPQGVDAEQMAAYMRRIEAFAEIPVAAPSDVMVGGVEPGRLKAALASLYAVVNSTNRYAVWQVGVVWLHQNGPLKAGQPFALVRVAPEFLQRVDSVMDEVRTILASALVRGDGDADEAAEVLVVDERGRLRPSNRNWA